MGLGNVLVLSQVTTFLLIFLLSFFSFIPLVVNNAEFNGHCLLFAQGEWVYENSTGHTEYRLHVDQWGSSSACDFPILVGVVTIPFTFFYLLWMSVYLFRGTEPSWLAGFVSVTSNILLLILTLCAAAVVTTGFHAWCHLVAPGRSCEYVEYMPVLEEKDIYTGHFYMELTMVQFGLWCSLVCWILQVCLAARQMFVYHRHEDFFISMQRERQRLIQKVHRPQPIV